MLGLEAWARIMVIHSKGVESSGSTFPALARILAEKTGNGNFTLITNLAKVLHIAQKRCTDRRTNHAFSELMQRVHATRKRAR